MVCLLLMVATTSVNVFADEIDPVEGGESGGGGSATGCYTETTIQCPSSPILNFGTRKLCNFTGTYGSPTACTETKCGNHDDDVMRKCVKGK